MTPYEAMHMLGAMHDEVQVGQGSMTIPVEIVEAVLGMWEDQAAEYAYQGNMESAMDVKILRPADEIMTRLVPLSKWIAQNQQKPGDKVMRRRIIIVEDWEELIKGAVS